MNPPANTARRTPEDQNPFIEWTARVPVRYETVVAVIGGGPGWLRWANARFILSIKATLAKREFLLGKARIATIPLFAFILSVGLSASAQENTMQENSFGMKMAPIPAGSFVMGQADGDWDERPVHKAAISRPFLMAVTEVTNAQYEQFDPSHSALRARNEVSREDDEAAVFVSWHEAMAFCQWLSKKEGKTYRLPTEAEWEYACRAGTATPYHTGETLPAEYVKNPDEKSAGGEAVDLRVGRTPPNAWGLCDMHGNVEEWCLDWYGPYEAAEQTDPIGRADGDFRVARGGSHSTEAQFLRSANRLSALPEDRHWLIGFRVVLGETPKTKPLPKPAAPLWARDVNQAPCDWASGPDPDEPFFMGPIRYVNIPPGSDGPMFSKHNHDPGLAYCPNGDLLAIWYSCNREPGRELCILASRLRRGAQEWDPPSPFWDAADRNDQAPALWHDGHGTLYHFNGLSVGPDYRDNLALVMRVSTDNGATWSRARLINSERGLPSQPVTTVFRAQDGRIVLPVDASRGLEGGGTALWMSANDGGAWSISQGLVLGIHGAVVQRKDGRLLGLGRFKTPVAAGAATGKRMPQSISSDMGRTWSYADSEFPPISGGQRLVLMRLREGPILLVSFTDFIRAAREGEAKGILLTDAAGRERRVYGMFAALSFDEGTTWPFKKLVTPGGPPRQMDGGGNTREFTMDANHAEPGGYLAATQTPDGSIHLISSALHYRFNLAWLKTPAPAESE